MNDYKKYFPIFNFENNKKKIYLDNACVTLKPSSVIQKASEYYEQYSACHNRSVHSFGLMTTKEFESSREEFKIFLNAKKNSEIIFTKNTTESINIIARGIETNINDVILTTSIEHNSNLLPWQSLSFTKGIVHKIIDVSPQDQVFNLETYKDIFKNTNVKLVSVPYVSHVTGMAFPIKEMIEIAHENGALFLLDAAQALTTHQIDVQKLDLDFLVGSIHKMFGPSGVGILYGKQQLLEKLNPSNLGGETVINATFSSFELAPLPARFEYGLQNYSGIIAAKEAIKFVKSISQTKINENNLVLNKLLTSSIKKLSGAQIIGPSDPALRPSILNFSISNLDMGEVSVLLDKTKDIMCRSGVHCTHAWYNHHKLKPTLRFSFSIYNDTKEIETVSETLSHIRHFI